MDPVIKQWCNIPVRLHKVRRKDGAGNIKYEDAIELVCYKVGKGPWYATSKEER